MATEVGTLVIKTDTTGVKQGQRDIERMGQSAAKTTQQTDRMASSTKRSSVSVGDFGRKAGMAGVQFEQLAGQIAMGQNPMRAIGVQAADLGFVLGVPLLGAVVGISAAIASVLIPATEDASDVIDDMKERLLDMEEGFDKLTAAQKNYLRVNILREIIALNDEIHDLTHTLGLRINPRFLDVTTLAAIDEMNAKIADLSGQYDDLNNNVAEGTDDINEYIESLHEEFAQLGMSERALHLYKLSVMGATEAQRLEADAILRKIEAHEVEIEQLKRIKDLQRETLEQIDAHDKEVKKAEDNAAKMAQLDETRIEREARLRDERLAQIEADRAKELISDKEYLDAKASIHAAYNTALAEDERRTMDEMNQIDQERRDFQKKLDEDRRAAAAEITNALLEFEDVLLKGKSEKEKAAYRLAINLADAEKRQNAADIMSKSYLAAMKAYASLAGIPIIGPALGAAAAAAAITVGTSYAAKSLTGRALGGQVRAGESYIVGERGPEVLTMGTGGRITPNEALRNESNTTANKTTNVSFNIEAADASGFDRLLNSRRGLIIQMINEAVEDQGREAFV
jgi:hypothetical protein